MKFGSEVSDVRLLSLWALIPALIAGLVYVNSLSNGFALDDIPLVRDNPQVLSVSASALGQPYGPGEAASALYRPLTTLSLAVNRAVGGAGPLGFHVVNVLLHALNCGLVWYVARRAGVHYGTAFLTALLFAVHPLHTEAVSNLAGRAELLAAAGVLAAWLAHRRAAESTLPQRQWCWIAFAGLAWMAALLSKEHAAMAPLVFMLDDRLRRRPVLRSGALTYAVILIGWLALRAHALGGLRGPETMIFLDNPAAFLGAGVRVATGLWVQVKYLGLFVWPARLSSDYSYDAIPVVRAAADIRLWAGLLWGATLGAALFYGWNRSRPVALGVLVWIAFFLPSSNLIFAVGTVMGERLAYLPSLGGCLLLGHLGAWLFFSKRSPLAGSKRRLGLVALIPIVAVVALAARSVARNPVWKDNASLALHDVEVMPSSAKLHAGAGIALHELGRDDEAEQAFRRAVAIYGDYAQMHYNLGQLLRARGAWEEAIEHLGLAGRISGSNPLPARSLEALAERLEGDGRPDLAIEAYGQASRLDPGDLPLRFNHGRALLAAGRVDDARDVLERLAEEHDAHLTGRLARALLLESRGDRASAVEAYRELLTRPDLPPGIKAVVEGRLGALQEGG